MLSFTHLQVRLASSSRRHGNLVSQRVPFCWLHEGEEGLLDKLIAVLPCNAFCQSWKTPSCTQLSSSLRPTTFAFMLYDENSRIVCICPGLIDSAKQCEHFLMISELFIHHIRDMRKASKLSKQGFAIFLHDFNFSLSFLLFRKSGKFHYGASSHRRDNDYHVCCVKFSLAVMRRKIFSPK